MRGLLAGCLLPFFAACATSESRVWNLEQLHDETSRHRYQAALQSDTGWFFRRGVLGLFQSTAAAWAAEVDREPVEDPTGECLWNLIALEERGAAEDEVDPRHVEWFARVAVEDRSKLSRERAVLALTRLGPRVANGLPARLGEDQKPAGPEDLAPVLEDLVRAVRQRIEGEAEASAAVTRAAAAVRALDLDLAAGRRALRAATELERLARGADVEEPDLDVLVAHLSNLLVRRALAAAIEDPEPIVRAAAVRGVVATGGARALDVVVFERLRTKESESAPLRAILEVLAELGLPRAADGEAPLAHAHEAWLRAVYSVAIGHPEGELRVRAMQTLRAVAAPDIASLREEDWDAWWLARRAANGTEPAP